MDKIFSGSDSESRVPCELKMSEVTEDEPEEESSVSTRCITVRSERICAFVRFCSSAILRGGTSLTSYQIFVVSPAIWKIA